MKILNSILVCGAIASIALLSAQNRTDKTEINPNFIMDIYTGK